MAKLPKLGPGLLVTAAFIGPGTLTTATLAGASTDLGLLWSVALAVAVAIVLQEMAARLGIASRLSLSEAAMGLSSNRLIRFSIGSLILVAIAYGNAAYQSGNLTGAVGGFESATRIDAESQPALHWAILIGMTVLAGALLWIGNVPWIQRILMTLVVGMSVLFVITAIMARPDPARIVRGLMIPTFDSSQLPTVLALIGTTVVPYNLFLHSRAVQLRWSKAEPDSVRESRWDTVISIGIGGLITAAIVVTSAAAFGANTTLDRTGDLAHQLEPFIGNWATLLFAIGLTAAGLTSAITAPLAAAYVVCGVAGREANPRSTLFRATWISVMLLGAGAVGWSTGKPTEIILAAQIANGLLLPIIALILLTVVNQRKTMGKFVNGEIANVVAGIFISIVSALAIYKLVKTVVEYLNG